MKLFQLKQRLKIVHKTHVEGIISPLQTTNVDRNARRIPRRYPLGPVSFLEAHSGVWAPQTFLSVTP